LPQTRTVTEATELSTGVARQLGCMFAVPLLAALGSCRTCGPDQAFRVSLSSSSSWYGSSIAHLLDDPFQFRGASHLFKRLMFSCRKIMSSLMFSCLLRFGFGIHSLVTTALSPIIPRSSCFVLSFLNCHSPGPS